MFKFLELLFITLIISGCTTFGPPYDNSINQSIINRTPHVALQSIKLKGYAKGDTVLFYLEKGMLLRLDGQYEKSIQAFELAKEKIEDLYTTSITKSTTSILLNDNITDYKGEEFENVMLHINQALSYLENKSFENAGVIARQLDVLLTEIENKKVDSKNNVYKCDPFANYLSAIIFESLNDWSSARIKYEKSYQCYKNSIYKIGVPQQVKLALVKSSEKSGAIKLYQKYKKEFSFTIENKEQNKGELIFVLDEGFIVSKRQVSTAITFHSNKGIRQLKISMPALPKYNPHLIKEVRLKVGSVERYAEKVQDLDSAARVSLNERMAAIKTRAIARAVKNQTIQNTAEQNGSFLTKFGSVILTSILERADVRGWHSLPHTVWMERVSLDAGTYDIEVDLIGLDGIILERKYFKNILITSNSKKNVYFRWGAIRPRNKDIKMNIVVPILH